MVKKMFHAIKRRIIEAAHGLRIILSDVVQNWIAAGVVCQIKLQPVLYRIAGNKIGKACYLSPRIFLGPGPGKLTGGYFHKL